MRSLLRFLFTFLSSIIIASCLLAILFPQNLDPDSEPSHDAKSDPGLSSWFSFRDPGSLFSPTATISLTDDNSTFFNAKPAAFGPSLPSSGLSGQMWVGSGFGNDNINLRGMAATMEGELGCSDIPGWTDRDWVPAQHRDTLNAFVGGGSGSRRSGSPAPKIKREAADSYTGSVVAAQSPPEEDDGSDDYFHWPLPKTPIENSQQQHGPSTVTLDYADIESMREEAGIDGKIVLLSRGGCGFAEKVKWAQRRGALAVIVADNVRGGPLVRMYARGDLSNITIPSLFTSHTTAHLLSHLIPPTCENECSSGSGKSTSTSSGPTSALDKASANTNAASLARILAESVAPAGKGSSMDSTTGGQPAPNRDDDIRFVSDLGFSSREDFKTGGKKSDGSTEDSKKWLRVKDFEEDEAWMNFKKSTKKAPPKPKDNFVIGVQDWRDPDMVHAADGGELSSSTSASPSSKSTSSVGTRNSQLKGGSITPGSGEYEQPEQGSTASYASRLGLTTFNQDASGNTEGSRWNWLRRLFHSSAKDSAAGGASSSMSTKSATATTTSEGSPNDGIEPPKGKPTSVPEVHNGLWVTLTPTDINASPFFNTLFVLVISPLITLAIVYSMLLLRSRIRRRRWRAPKSVVERLPVRVYHALSSRTSPASESPEMNTATSTTPLLAGSRPTEITGRARSRAVSAAAASSLPSSSQYGSLDASSLEQEKVAQGLAEWKRKYGGKQKECVVCLEEYIDGVSRVMSLPCGHEFHVDCITPWLTTRRRTCPICKGDVVRSLARPTASTRREANDMSEEEVQQQAAERSNLSMSSSLPVPLSAPSPDADVERAERSETPVSESGTPTPSWLLRNFNRGLDYFGGVQHHDRDHPPLDRTR